MSNPTYVAARLTNKDDPYCKQYGLADHVMFVLVSGLTIFPDPYRTECEASIWWAYQGGISHVRFSIPGDIADGVSFQPCTIFGSHIIGIQNNDYWTHPSVQPTLEAVG